MKPSSNRARAGVIEAPSKRRAARFGGHHEAHVPTFRHSVDHIGIVQQSRLHPSGRPPRERFGQKYATCRQLAHFVRTTLGQYLALRARRRHARSARLRPDTKC